MSSTMSSTDILCIIYCNSSIQNFELIQPLFSGSVIWPFTFPTHLHVLIYWNICEQSTMIWKTNECTQFASSIRYYCHSANWNSNSLQGRPDQKCYVHHNLYVNLNMKASNVVRSLLSRMYTLLYSTAFSRPHSKLVTKKLEHRLKNGLTALQNQCISYNASQASISATKFCRYDRYQHEQTARATWTAFENFIT